jgi:hypothetical protein
VLDLPGFMLEALRPRLFHLDNAMTDFAADKMIIRELVDNWVVYRDARLWDQFRKVWHAEGRMMATWFQGGYEEFIKVNDEGWARGVRILHFLGGNAIEVSGNRAISQTKMTISQRASVEGVICDVLCTGRFYDFFDRRDGRWGLVLRQPIYEKDRLDPVDPKEAPVLDKALLESFPEGYRHLAYLQSKIGYKVKPDMPGFEGPALDALYARGARWLKGEPL